MDTKTAVVTGARHLRLARNGQDAAAAWRGEHAAAVVVCDGCSSGASSEVGARLGARLAIRVLAEQLAAGASVADPELWAAVRVELRDRIATVVERDRQLLEDCFLFTIVVGAVDREHAAVWAIGDGAYSIGSATRQLGPFADNQPPYLAYDLVGEPAAAELDVAARATIVIATDGVLDLPGEVSRFGAARFVEHGDALRRELALLARSDERIDWDERRIARAPAQLQDDCAIGVIRVEAS